MYCGGYSYLCRMYCMVYSYTGSMYVGMQLHMSYVLWDIVIHVVCIMGIQLYM